MRVVTLNTWKGDGDYAARLAAMAAGLAALRPDIVALQEVLKAPEAGHDTAAHIANALKLTASVLPLRWKVRTVDGRAVDSTSGLALLSRAPLRNPRSVRLASDPRDGERAALIADMAMDGQMLTVACLHLTHLSDADELRRQQWREVAAALPGTVPVVVAGDFNAPIETFDLTDSRFADSRQTCGEPVQSTVLGHAPASFDHVLFSPGCGLVPTRWRTALGESQPGTTVTPSDHLAVVVDFEAAMPTMHR
ncbi:MAG TPA: endonuclease/exonuclease/phosphatase family protein [Alphaproteobacteria bacterium]